MIKRYDRETHSEFIKKFRKLFNPQKWDKIVKDNAETYIKHGKFQKDFISGTAMMLLILIITVPFMYLGIVFVTIILALLDVMLFIVTIAFPLACHYLLNREVQFKKEVRKIFGKETEHVLGKGSAGHSSIYQKTLSFIQEVNRQEGYERGGPVPQNEALHRGGISPVSQGKGKRKGKEAGELQQVHLRISSGRT